jgi:hypothetical protein
MLIPALIAGARLGGITGVSAAEAAVAGGVILPWYLCELRRADIGRRVLGSRLRLPLAGAAVAGLAAAAAARVLPSDLIALGVSGMAGLAVVGLLVFRMRAALIQLRSGRAETTLTAVPSALAVPSSTPVSSAVPRAQSYRPGPSTRLSAPGVQNPPVVMAEAAGPAGRRHDEACCGGLPSWLAHPDTTGPLPIFDSVVRRRYPSYGDRAARAGWRPATGMRSGEDSGATGVRVDHEELAAGRKEPGDDRGQLAADIGPGRENGCSPGPVS